MSNKKYKFTGRLSEANEIIAVKSGGFRRYIPLHTVTNFIPNHRIAVDEEVTVLLEFYTEPRFKPIQSNPQYHKLEIDCVKSMKILEHHHKPFDNQFPMG